MPCRQGTVEAANTAPYYYFGKDPTFALGCAIPFGLNSRQMTAWMYEGNGLKLMREFYRNYNIISFPMGNTGAQMGGWFRKPITSVADVKGLKFRTGGFSGVIWERIGGVAANIPGGEIYAALEKGTIDAAEWVGPYDDQKLGFNKIAQNYAYPGYWEGGPQLDLHVNIKAYEALSSEYKAIVEAAAAYAHVDMQAKYDARNASCAQAAGGRRHQAVPFSQRCDGCCLQGIDGHLFGVVGKEPRLEKGLRRFQHLPPRCQSVVPFHRGCVRRLHAGCQAVRFLLPKKPRFGGFFWTAEGLEQLRA